MEIIVNFNINISEYCIWLHGQNFKRSWQLTAITSHTAEATEFQIEILVHIVSV